MKRCLPASSRRTWWSTLLRVFHHRNRGLVYSTETRHPSPDSSAETTTLLGLQGVLVRYLQLKGGISMYIYVCTINSYVNLCVHHLFPCTFVCTIYSHVHLCVHYLFPCVSMCGPFSPMCIYVCTIYSLVHLCVHHLFHVHLCEHHLFHVHLCVHHLFPCASMCAPFIPMCIYVCNIYSHVHPCECHLF